MDYNCCDFLLHEIAFYCDSIRPCCSFSIDRQRLFEYNFDGSLSAIDEYLKIRNEYIESFRSGKYPACYNGCTIFQKTDSKDISLKLNNLIISNRTYCSCRCIYCEHAGGENEEYRNYLNSFKPYDIKPILNRLRTANLIEKDCRFLVCGGEFSEYPKNEQFWLLYWALSLDCHLLILTSGIRYSQAIERILKIPNNIVKISIDSGTKETFNKIKKVDEYENTWNNIKKYIDITKKYKAKNTFIELKYIIIPEINDTVEEVDAFINKCKKYGCKNIRLDVEHVFMENNKNNPDKIVNVKKIVNYFFNKLVKMKGMFIDFEGVEREWLTSLLEDKSIMDKFYEV